MSKVTNTTQGRKGAYLGGALVWADPGQTIEADDYLEEWFEEAGDAGQPLEDPVSEPAPDDPDDEDDDQDIDDLPPTDEEIRAAVGELDKDNDGHWTAAGEPAVAAMAKVLQAPRLSRADIKRAAPDAARPD